MSREEHITSKHGAILQVLLEAKPALRKAILNALPKETVYCLCEISDNLLCGNIPVTPQQKSKIARHKKVLRQLARRGEALAEKRKAIQQGGGAFIPILLSVLASAIGSKLFK